MSEDRPSGDVFCNGCAVCTLSCPVWRQTSNLQYTYCGRKRAEQRGYSPLEMKTAIEACLLCGSCEPVCSFGARTIKGTLAQRRALTASECSDVAREARGIIEAIAPVVAPRSAGAARVFINGPAMRDNPRLLEHCLRLLGAHGCTDEAHDVSFGMQAGFVIPDERLAWFKGSMGGVREVIAEEGLLHVVIRELLPGVRVMGLGEALLNLPDFRLALGPGDLYVIESRGYHADFLRLVGFYDSLRHAQGCMMNLDLHRTATPTGAASLQHVLGLGVVDPVEQARWICEGRDPGRIVVERLEDMEPFKAVTGVPVIHVSELA